jgi:hypothetical protein
VQGVNKEGSPTAHEDTVTVAMPCYNLPLRMMEISRPPPITAAMT